MRRRIAASVGLFGLIGAAWFGVRGHVIGAEPPVTPATVPAAVPTELPTVQPFFERIDATPSKRTKRSTAVKTKVETAPETAVITQEPPELVPLVPTTVVPMAVPATGSSFESLCQRLQPVLKKRFPKCGIELISHRDGIVIKGSAATAQQAATIFAAVQTVVDLNSPTEHPQSGKVVNQLEIPSEAQVQLSFKIIEADRNVVNDALQQSCKREQSKSQSEPTPPLPPAITQAIASGVYSKTVVDEATAKILKDSQSKTMCEPTLTVVSGRSATFMNGGEFAFPTIVGVGNAKGTTPTVRGFGTTIQATPTVINHEQLRLALMFESSRVDEANKTAGIPGINVRRINTLVQLNAEQSLVMEFPNHPNAESYESHSVRDVGPPPIAAGKKDQPADIERCLFIVVTPTVLKLTAINEVLPHPVASRVDANSMTTYTPFPSLGMTASSPIPPAILYADRIPPVRDLLLRTPIPATEWSQPMATPLFPPADPFGNPIQQLGAWQPMNGAITPWPSVGPQPSNVPTKTSRLEHLKSARKHLEAASLTEQVAEIQKEIELEQKSETRRELKQREQQLETLQRQIESLRRSLSLDEVPQPE